MESRFIFFVVMASLAQSSFALPSNVTWGLTDDELAGLTQITINQDAALAAKFKGFTPVFDIIEKSVSSLIYNLGFSVGLSDVLTLFHGLSSVKDAMDHSLDAVRIAVGGSCSGVEKARKETHGNIERAYTNAIHALLLSITGETSVTLRDAVLNELRSLGKNVQNLILGCIDTKDEGVEAMLQQSQSGAGLALDHMTYAVFNAFTLHAAAVTAKTANASLTVDIEGCRQQTLEGIRADITNKYSSLKSLYIYSKLNRTGILVGLTRNQYTLAVSDDKFQGLTETIFGTILRNMDGVSLALTHAGRLDFSRTDADRAIALAKLVAGYKVFINSMSSMRPNDASAISNTDEVFDVLAVEEIDTIYEAIDVAEASGRTNSSDSLKEIDALGEKLLSISSGVAVGYFDVIRNGKSWAADSEFIALQNRAADQIAVYMKSIFNGIRALAEAVIANRTSNSDYSKVLTAKTAANSALHDFAQCLSAAGLIQIKADNTN